MSHNSPYYSAPQVQQNQKHSALPYENTKMIEITLCHSQIKSFVAPGSRADQVSKYSQAFSIVANWTVKQQFKSTPLGRSQSHWCWAQHTTRCMRLPISILLHSSTMLNLAHIKKQSRRMQARLTTYQAKVIKKHHTNYLPFTFFVLHWSRYSANSLFVDPAKSSADFHSFHNWKMEDRSLTWQTKLITHSLPLEGTAIREITNFLHQKTAQVRNET